MKVVKWILGIFAVLFLGLVLYLTLLFDPNDFKPEIVDAVKKQTGRELVISQDLNWTFFPTLGIELGGISLSNPDGFDEKQMLAVNQVVAEVALMPLFRKEVEIAQLNLDGLKLDLITQKDGRTSLDGLSGDAGTAKEQPKNTEGNAQGLASLNIGGINITNTQIHLLDKRSGSDQTFVLESLTLGEFSLGKFAPLAYKFSGSMPDMKIASEGKGQLKISADMKQLEITGFAIENRVEGKSMPGGKLSADLNADVKLDLNRQNAELVLSSLKVADIEGKGDLKVAFGGKVPDVKAKLALGEIDLDKLLPAGEEDKAAVKTTESATAAKAGSEPDLSAMKQVNFAMDLTVKTIKAAGLTTENWKMDLALNNGVLDMKQLSADLYQGKLMTKAQLDGRNKVASYNFDTQLSGVKIQPLLKDAADLEILAGATAFNVNGKGKSLIPDNIKQNLDANGKFEISDGALYGVNIPHMIRSAQAKLKGDLSAQEEGERKTDFSSLTGSFSLKNGVANNPDLAMASPLIRLAGAGSANLISEQLDYKLKTSVVGSLKGQGGEGKNDLAGVEIPLMISGSFQEPKFALDTQALFDSKLKEETEKVKDKLKDSIFKKLGGGK